MVRLQKVSISSMRIMTKVAMSNPTILGEQSLLSVRPCHVICRDELEAVLDVVVLGQ
jgi:hypothetical protein